MQFPKAEAEPTAKRLKLAEREMERKRGPIDSARKIVQKMQFIK